MANDVEVLDALVRAEYEALCALDEEARAFPCPKPNPRFAPAEAASFLAGLKAGLFDIVIGTTTDGRPEIVYRSCHWGGTSHFFGTASRGKARRTFSRESVCTRAARSDLVLRYGWPIKGIDSQPWGGGLDFAAYDRARSSRHRRPLLVGEGKSRPRDIIALRAEMEGCAGLRPSAHEGGGHKKCDGLLAALDVVESVYLWLVSPSERALLLARRGRRGGYSLELATPSRAAFKPLQRLLDDTVGSSAH